MTTIQETKKQTQASVFKEASGYGPAFREAAMRLGCFTMPELLRAVDSIRPPGTGAAKDWISRQREHGAITRLKSSPQRVGVYSVLDAVDFWGRPRFNRTNGAIHAWRGDSTVGGACGGVSAAPLPKYAVRNRPVKGHRVCRHCLSALMKEAGVGRDSVSTAPPAPVSRGTTDAEAT